jgi:hypothetical protein
LYANLLQATRVDEVERAREDPAAVSGALDLRPGLPLLDVGCGTGRLPACDGAAGGARRGCRRRTWAASHLAIAEWDWGSTCFAVSDRDLGRRVTHHLRDRMDNGLIARELPSALVCHGFVSVDVVPQARIQVDLGAAHTWLIRPAIEEFVRVGTLTEAEGTALLEGLEQRDATGTYGLARTYDVPVGTAG